MFGSQEANDILKRDRAREYSRTHNADAIVEVKQKIKWQEEEAETLYDAYQEYESEYRDAKEVLGNLEKELAELESGEREA